VGLTNLGSESETCVGSLVHLVAVSISFEKNFYRLPFTPPSLVRRIGPSTTMSDIPAGASVLTGTFSINDTPVKVLFDSGATHSFISERLINKLGLKGSHITSTYKIITPGGQITSNILI
jgi:hypothetical protein